ncbi:MAG: LPS export ABC transporter periplasmic protein LptC [Paludibacteraceae bacterium]|nr:LPS export ABC transporter periplasmic protein LptC [Paludibacteraceae bacterium]
MRFVAHIFYSVAITLVATLCLQSCSKDVKLQAAAVDDRAKMPLLDAHDVTSLISDSGIVRYRITTPSWQIYDMAQPPYWEFPEGIYLEKFNLNLKAEAFLEANYAHYNKEAELWHLVGNVKALNLEGETFESPEMWWSQKEERVYTDKQIYIHRANSIIYGVGFESNQTMTKYTIRRPTGVIPVEDEEVVEEEMEMESTETETSSDETIPADNNDTSTSA